MELDPEYIVELIFLSEFPEDFPGETKYIQVTVEAASSTKYSRLA